LGREPLPLALDQDSAAEIGGSEAAASHLSRLAPSCPKTDFQICASGKTVSRRRWPKNRWSASKAPSAVM